MESAGAAPPSLSHQTNAPCTTPEVWKQTTKTQIVKPHPMNALQIQLKTSPEQPILKTTQPRCQSPQTKPPWKLTQLNHLKTSSKPMNDLNTIWKCPQSALWKHQPIIPNDPNALLKTLHKNLPWEHLLRLIEPENLPPPSVFPKARKITICKARYLWKRSSLYPNQWKKNPDQSQIGEITMATARRRNVTGLFDIQP